MAIRLSHRARPAFVAAALAATAMIAPTVAPELATAAPSAPHAKPTIDDVQKQLGRLALQNSQLVERYDHARVMVVKRDKTAAAARAQQQQAESGYRAANMQFAQNVQAQYQSGGLGAAGALLESNSGTNYLDRLDTLSLISNYDAGVVSRLKQARANAVQKSQQAQTLLSAAKHERDGIATKKDAVTKQIDKYRTLLGTLNAQQRAAYQKSANPSVDASKLKDLPGGASASAKRAVNFAINQVGKPYVFGADGPGAYDCSGLTMKAWQAGGVSLPHSAEDQYNYGKHVGMNALSPGDLIFMYQPIGHVTIYIGDGMMVSAPTEGENVKVVPVDQYSGDIVGATHLG